MLLKSVQEIQQGLYEAFLGDDLFKKRIASKGRGKSSSVRTILTFRSHKTTFFLYGYEKNERENVSKNEVNALKIIGKSMQNFTKIEIEERLDNGSLIEVKYDK